MSDCNWANVRIRMYVFLRSRPIFETDNMFTTIRSFGPRSSPWRPTTLRRVLWKAGSSMIAQKRLFDSASR